MWVEYLPIDTENEETDFRTSITGSDATEMTGSDVTGIDKCNKAHACSAENPAVQQELW